MLAACVSSECSEDSRTDASSYFSSAVSSDTNRLPLAALVLVRNPDDVLDLGAKPSLSDCFGRILSAALQLVEVEGP